MHRQDGQNSSKRQPFKWFRFGHFSAAWVTALLAFVVTAQASSLAMTIRVEALVDGSTQGGQTPRSLEPGELVERELAGGETQSYQINLSEDQFLYLSVDQQGIDVVVTLFGPDGKQILEVDSPNGDRGPEQIWYVSAAAGAYKSVVSSPDKQAATGRYAIRIEDRRAATNSERQRADAQKIQLEGMRLLSQKTAESSKQAVQKYQVALDLWRASGDRQGEADALANIGQLYSDRDDDEALQYLERGLTLARELGDKRREATLLFQVAERNITHTVERKRKALSYYHQSLVLMREINDRWGEAQALNQLGIVYAALSETQKALDSFLPLLSLARSLGDRGREGITLNYIGGLYSWFGDYQKALDYYTEALALTRAIGDREVEVFSLENVGQAYFGLGDYERALAYFEQADQLNQDDPESHARTLNDIGSVYAKLGSYQKALDSYNQSLAIDRQLGNVRQEASTLGNIGTIYRELREYQKALDFYDQALPLKRHVGDRRGEATLLIISGSVQLLLGDAQKSLNLYQRAFEISRAVADQTSEAQSLDGMARAQRNLGNLAEACKHIEAALAIVESLREKITTRELRISYYASVQLYYETYIDVLMRLHRVHPAEGYDAAALQASERGRSRGLLEILNEAHVDIRQGVDLALLERERSLQQQLGAKAELQTRLLGSKHAPAEIAALKRETDGLLLMYREVEAQIRTSSPLYAALTQPVPLNLKEIQQQVLDSDTLLLEYRLGDEGSYLWAVTSNSLDSYALPKRIEIDAAARRVYDLLTARNRRVKFETAEETMARVARADADYLDAARVLSDMLLARVKGRLGKKRLLIVGDGALNYIPFAALPRPASESTDNKGHQIRTAASQPLVLDHECINLPSILSLAIMRRELAGRKPAAKMLAVLADPVFDRDDERVRNHQVRRRADLRQAVFSPAPSQKASLQPDLLRSIRETTIGDEAFKIQRLPSTRREANQIAALVAPAQRKAALDFAASLSTATSAELGHYRYLHFATHGFLNSTHPELSGIVLSLVDQDGKDQDGFLRTYEIFNLKLPAEMVVLSGCRTGLGREIKGEGLVGLTHGFLYAGAARVMVSLWDIADEASAELMVELYREMWGKGRLRPSAALRAAQLKVWKQKRWEAPYYWAGFVLQGEPR